MLGIDEIIGFLVVLFILIFPVIRMILLKRAEKRKKEMRPASIAEEEKEKPWVPPKAPRPLPPVKPPSKPVARAAAVQGRGKRAHHHVTIDPKNLVIYHEIFGKPKGLE